MKNTRGVLALAALAAVIGIILSCSIRDDNGNPVNPGLPPMPEDNPGVGPGYDSGYVPPANAVPLIWLETDSNYVRPNQDFKIRLKLFADTAAGASPVYGDTVTFIKGGVDGKNDTLLIAPSLIVIYGERVVADSLLVTDSTGGATVRFRTATTGIAELTFRYRGHNATMRLPVSRTPVTPVPLIRVNTDSNHVHTGEDLAITLNLFADTARGSLPVRGDTVYVVKGGGGVTDTLLINPSLYVIKGGAAETGLVTDAQGRTTILFNSAAEGNAQLTFRYKGQEATMGILVISKDEPRTLVPLIFIDPDSNHVRPGEFLNINLTLLADTVKGAPGITGDTIKVGAQADTLLIDPSLVIIKGSANAAADTLLVTDAQGRASIRFRSDTAGISDLTFRYKGHQATIRIVIAQVLVPVIRVDAGNNRVNLGDDLTVNLTLYSDTLPGAPGIPGDTIVLVKGVSNPDTLLKNPALIVINGSPTDTVLITDAQGRASFTYNSQIEGPNDLTFRYKGLEFKNTVEVVREAVPVHIIRIESGYNRVKLGDDLTVNLTLSSDTLLGSPGIPGDTIILIKGVSNPDTLLKNPALIVINGSPTDTVLVTDAQGRASFTFNSQIEGPNYLTFRYKGLEFKDTIDVFSPGVLVPVIRIDAGDKRVRLGDNLTVSLTLLSDTLLGAPGIPRDTVVLIKGVSNSDTLLKNPALIAINGSTTDTLLVTDAQGRVSFTFNSKIKGYNLLTFRYKGLEFKDTVDVFEGAEIKVPLLQIMPESNAVRPGESMNVALKLFADTARGGTGRLPEGQVITYTIDGNAVIDTLLKDPSLIVIKGGDNAYWFETRTDANGDAVAIIPPMYEGIAMVTFEYNGQQITIQIPVSANPATPVISVSKTTLLADGMDKSTVTLIVRNDHNNPIVGDTVFFQVTAGAGIHSTGAGTIPRFAITDDLGRASVQFTSGNQNGVTTITAIHKQFGKAPDSISIQVVTRGARITADVTPQSIKSTGEMCSIAVKLFNAADRPVANDTVTARSAKGYVSIVNPKAATNGLGEILFLAAGPGSTTKPIDDYTDTVWIRWGVADSIPAIIRFSDNILTIGGAASNTYEIGEGKTSTFTIRYTLNNGTTNISGARLDVGVTAVNSRDAFDTVLTTNASGSATFTIDNPIYAYDSVIISVRASSGTAGGAAVNSPTSATRKYLFTPVKVDSISLTGTPAVIQTGGNSAELIATALDEKRNRVANALISFSFVDDRSLELLPDRVFPGNGAYLTPGTAVTGLDGTARIRLVSGNVPSDFRGVWVRATHSYVDVPGGEIEEVHSDYKTGQSIEIHHLSNATQFTIAGPPHRINVGWAMDKGLKEYTATYGLPVAAIVADVNGNPVVDSTPVTFSVQEVGYAHYRKIAVCYNDLESPTNGRACSISVTPMFVYFDPLHKNKPPFPLFDDINGNGIPESGAEVEPCDPLTPPDRRGPPPIDTTYDTSYIYVPMLDQDGNPVPKLDQFGNPIFIPKLDQEGNQIPKLDQYGNQIPKLDQYGNPIFKLDQYGNPIPKLDRNGNQIPKLDQHGNPIRKLDQYGNPIPKLDQYGYPMFTPNEEPIYVMEMEMEMVMDIEMEMEMEMDSIEVIDTIYTPRWKMCDGYPWVDYNKNMVRDFVEKFANESHEVSPGYYTGTYVHPDSIGSPWSQYTLQNRVLNPKSAFSLRRTTLTENGIADNELIYAQSDALKVIVNLSVEAGGVVLYKTEDFVLPMPPEE